jgi:hypothetical protein
MDMRTTSARRLTAGFALGALLFGSHAASAADAKAIADALVAASAATGRVQASYDSAAAEGDAIAIVNYKLLRTNAQTIVIPKLVITGAEPRQPGGFTAESIAFNGGKATHGKDTVNWETGLVEGAVVPSAEEVKAESDVRPFAKLTMAKITAEESNLADKVTVNDVVMELESAADGSTGAFASEVNGIHFTSAVFNDQPQQKAVLDALGYEAFDVNVAAAGTFDATAEQMTLSGLTINTADVGTLTVKAQLSGVSPGGAVTSNTQAETRSDAKLNSLEIRFDNSGVVERALDMHAAMTLGTRADAAAQAKALVPIGLHFIGGDAAFQGKVAKAIGDFLDNPKSITFTAAPSAPVTLEEIGGAAMSKPDTLPTLLGADITAN